VPESGGIEQPYLQQLCHLGTRGSVAQDSDQSQALFIVVFQGVVKLLQSLLVSLQVRKYEM